MYSRGEWKSDLILRENFGLRQSLDLENSTAYNLNLAQVCGRARRGRLSSECASRSRAYWLILCRSSPTPIVCKRRSHKHKLNTSLSLFSLLWMWCGYLALFALISARYDTSTDTCASSSSSASDTYSDQRSDRTLSHDPNPHKWTGRIRQKCDTKKWQLRRKDRRR